MFVINGLADKQNTHTVCQSPHQTECRWCADKKTHAQIHTKSTITKRDTKHNNLVHNCKICAKQIHKTAAPPGIGFCCHCIFDVWCRIHTTGEPTRAADLERLTKCNNYFYKRAKRNVTTQNDIWDRAGGRRNIIQLFLLSLCVSFSLSVFCVSVRFFPVWFHLIVQIICNAFLRTNNNFRQSISAHSLNCKYIRIHCNKSTIRSFMSDVVFSPFTRLNRFYKKNG